MVGPDKHDQHATIGHATETTDPDDDIIREELHRRDDFDRRFRPALTRLLIRPDARERDRLTTMAAEEIKLRFAFDQAHPRIYKTPEERQRAYRGFLPPHYDPSWLEEDGPGPIVLPFQRPPSQQNG